MSLEIRGEVWDEESLGENDQHICPETGQYYLGSLERGNSSAPSRVKRKSIQQRSCHEEMPAKEPGAREFREESGFTEAERRAGDISQQRHQLLGD